MTTVKAEGERRLDVIEALLREAGQNLGRTSIMKCLYFLQEVEKIPLGYRFRLYTYGPYDPEVLSDLDHAEALGRIQSRLVTFPNGNQGYLYRVASAKPKSAPSGEHRTKIAEVARAFAGRSAGDLEMASTIVFVDRHHQRAGRTVPVEQLIAEVQEIKPHLERDRIRSEIEKLRGMGYLEAVR